MDSSTNPIPNPKLDSAPITPVSPASPLSASGLAAPINPSTPVAPPSLPVPPVTSGTGAGPVFNQMPASEAFMAQASGTQPLVSATDPITMPAPPKAPNPIEEELKAPFKPADPVPGSIGSAISVPEGVFSPNGGSSHTPNVSFNDPATSESLNSTLVPTKNKKSTLIVLVVIASIIVVVLGVVLVMQLLPSGN